MSDEEIKIVELENGDVEIRKIIKNDEVIWPFSGDEYQLLYRISAKYRLPLHMILELLLLEARAVKKGHKNTPLKDLSSIITKYINKMEVD